MSPEVPGRRWLTFIEKTLLESEFRSRPDSFLSRAYALTFTMSQSQATRDVRAKLGALDLEEKERKRLIKQRDHVIRMRAVMGRIVEAGLVVDAVEWRLAERDAFSIFKKGRTDRAELKREIIEKGTLPDEAQETARIYREITGRDAEESLLREHLTERSDAIEKWMRPATIDQRTYGVAMVIAAAERRELAGDVDQIETGAPTLPDLVEANEGPSLSVRIEVERTKQLVERVRQKFAMAQACKLARDAPPG